MYTNSVLCSLLGNVLVSLGVHFALANQYHTTPSCVGALYHELQYSVLGSVLVTPGLHFCLADPPRPPLPSQTHPSVPNVTSTSYILNIR